jgi:hypothetical protein
LLVSLASPFPRWVLARCWTTRWDVGLSLSTSSRRRLPSCLEHFA